MTIGRKQKYIRVVPRPQRLSAVAENRQAHELGTVLSIDLKFSKDGPEQSEGAIQKLYARSALAAEVGYASGFT